MGRTRTEQLDELRRAVVEARAKQRDVGLALAAAERAATHARTALVESLAEEGDSKAAARTRERKDEAVGAARLQVEAARLRVDRAERATADFEAANARELLDEREPFVAEALRLLDEGRRALIAGDRLWRSESGRIGRLLAHVVGDSRGVAPEQHGLESIARELRRSEADEIRSPLPDQAHAPAERTAA